MDQIRSLKGPESDEFKEVLSAHPTPDKAAVHRTGESVKRAERREKEKLKQLLKQEQVIARPQTNRNYFHPIATAQLKAAGGKATAEKVAKLWNGLTPALRAPYDAMAVADQLRYYSE